MATGSRRQNASKPKNRHLPDVIKITEKARHLHFDGW
jgi:hypothetical protein